MVLHERGEKRVVWGVSGRCLPTWPQWGCMAPEDLRVAALPGEHGGGLTWEAQTLLVQFFPALTLVWATPHAWLFRPADQVLPAPPTSAAQPIRTSFHSGFFGPQSAPLDAHCFCGTGVGKVTLTNPSDLPRKARLRLWVRSEKEQARLWVEGPGFTDEREIATETRVYERVLTLPPGKTLLRLSSDACRGPAHVDQLGIVFHVPRFEVTDVAP
jgi:hypothetical protein